MTVGAFAVLVAAGTDDERNVAIDDLAGLAQRRPWLAFAMAVFMLSLLGFPGTAGFIGKWFILSSVIDAGEAGLAIVLVVTSVVSAGYYLPVIMAMYMKPPVSEEAHASVGLPGAGRVVVAVAAVLLLVFGFWPNRALDLAHDGSDGLRPEVILTNTPQ
jgi:NADH-quinone oxidoreductase subunit N